MADQNTKKSSSLGLGTVVVALVAGVAGGLAVPYIIPYLPQGVVPVASVQITQSAAVPTPASEYDLAYQQAMARVGAQVVSNTQVIDQLEQALIQLNQGLVYMQQQQQNLVKKIMVVEQQPAPQAQPIPQRVEPKTVVEKPTTEQPPAKKMLGGLIKLQKVEE